MICNTEEGCGGGIRIRRVHWHHKIDDSMKNECGDTVFVAQKTVKFPKFVKLPNCQSFIDLKLVVGFCQVTPDLGAFSAA